MLHFIGITWYLYCRIHMPLTDYVCLKETYFSLSSFATFFFLLILLEIYIFWRFFPFLIFVCFFLICSLFLQKKFIANGII